jgi:hypothetical protein
MYVAKFEEAVTLARERLKQVEALRREERRRR